MTFVFVIKKRHNQEVSRFKQSLAVAVVSSSTNKRSTDDN